MNTSNTSVTINCEFNWVVHKQRIYDAYEEGIGNILFVSNTKEIAENFIKENFPNYSSDTISDSSFLGGLLNLEYYSLGYYKNDSPFMIVLSKIEPFQGVVGPE